jgi:hypothetical protein
MLYGMDLIYNKKIVMSFLYLFWHCHVCRLLNVSHLNLITNPTPLPNTTPTIRAAAHNPNYQGSSVYPNYWGSCTQPLLLGLPHATLTIRAAACNPNSRGSQVRPCQGRRYARALPSRLALHARCLHYALTTIK